MPVSELSLPPFPFSWLLCNDVNDYHCSVHFCAVIARTWLMTRRDTNFVSRSCIPMKTSMYRTSRWLAGHLQSTTLCKCWTTYQSAKCLTWLLLLPASVAPSLLLWQPSPLLSTAHHASCSQSATLSCLASRFRGRSLCISDSCSQYTL